MKHITPTPGKMCFSFAIKKRPLPTAGAKPWILYVNLKCTHSRKLGALYQFVVRKPVREYANDYLYISENIYVQTEPHIHPGCRFPYFSSNVNPVNSTYHLSPLSEQFPPTHKTKKSGSQNLSYDNSKLPEIPCFLHFSNILFFDL